MFQVNVSSVHAEYTKELERREKKKDWWGETKNQKKCFTNIVKSIEGKKKK